MDECQGTTINDSSGNANTGTLNIGGSGTYTSAGNCTTSSATSAWYNGATGKRNYSMAFDGTDDYVNLADPASGILDVQKGNFTLSGWSRPATLGGGAYLPIIAKGTTGDGTYTYMLYLDATSKAAFRYMTELITLFYLEPQLSVSIIGITLQLFTMERISIFMSMVYWKIKFLKVLLQAQILLVRYI